MNAVAVALRVLGRTADAVAAARAATGFLQERQDRSGTLALALRSITDVNVAESHSDQQLLKRNDGLNVIRYGVANQTTAQK